MTDIPWVVLRPIGRASAHPACVPSTASCVNHLPPVRFIAHQVRGEVFMPTIYTGEAGARYFEHIKASSAEHVQQYASRVFLPYVKPSMRVLDFGCGNGGILSNIPCAERIGIEVNEILRRRRAAGGLRCIDLWLRCRMDDVKLLFHTIAWNTLLIRTRR